MHEERFGKFGALIGVIHVSRTHCKFLIYSTKNAEILTSHEAVLKQIVHNAGWLEYDALEIWKATQECMEVGYQNLVMLEINPQDLQGIAICTLRGNCVMWDRTNGLPLHNVIGWTDCRAINILQTLLHKVKDNKDYLRCTTGLPLSNCFSALKLKWLLEHVPAVKEATEKGDALFGTLDTWLLWNLTGGSASGVHATDVTNAAFTSLMDIKTLQWDPKLCLFFHIPITLLPRIRSNAEIYGYITEGLLSGLPIASLIGEQPACLLGQLCTKVGRTVCTLDDSCFVLLNTGKQLVESRNGLLSTVGFKLGSDAAVCYALEGAVANAGAAVDWLKNRLGVRTDVNENTNVADTLTSFLGESSMITSSCSSSMLNVDGGLAAKRSDVLFVPAFHGLYSPFWRYDARGILLGLTSQTTAENVTQATYEAAGFQIHDILEAFKQDTAPTWNAQMLAEAPLTVGGEWAEDSNFLQYITDIVGRMLQRPQTVSPPCLGAMIAAGICLQSVTLSNAELRYKPPADALIPTTTPNRRELLYKRWEFALKKCLMWNGFDTYEQDVKLFAEREYNPYRNICRSIPGSVYVISSFVLLIVANILRKT